MTNDDQIEDEKLQYQPYHQAKLTSVNISLMKKCYLLIKSK